MYETSLTDLVVLVTTQSMSDDMCQDNTLAISGSAISAKCPICIKNIKV